MPTGTTAYPRYNAEDPEDRRILIENGIIWKSGLPKAIELAIGDLVSGRVPMNDKVPPEIAAQIAGEDADDDEDEEEDETVEGTEEDTDDTEDEDELEDEEPE